MDPNAPFQSRRRHAETSGLIMRVKSSKEGEKLENYTKYRLKDAEELSQVLSGTDKIFVVACNKCFKEFESVDEPDCEAFVKLAEEKGKTVTGAVKVDFLCNRIQTERKLVVITAPGPGSGKMATCLSQLYHENKRGVAAGYAKFETFPIWNLPLRHPVNLAYEAATSDLNDVNMIDPFHLEAYGKTTVNYNRDVEIFPVLNAMFEKIMGESPYKSPTDMGVNMAGNCIIDDDAVCKAAKEEIVRRYYVAMCGKKEGFVSDDEILKLELLMKQAGVSPTDRNVVNAALKREEETGGPAAALELPDGRMITGKTSNLMGAASAVLLNALKVLGGIDDDVLLMSPQVIEPITNLKIQHLGNRNPRIHTDEALIALSICAATDENARKAMDQLEKLSGSEVHSTVILSQVDERTFKRLGVNLTCEPKFN